MPKILSIGEAIPPYKITQEETMKFAKELFSDSFKDIDRLLRAFHNGQVEKRHFIKGLDWFSQEHDFEEKNNAYIDGAVQLGTEAIKNCLSNSNFLCDTVAYDDITTIFTVTSTGVATPSIEAMIMNHLPFSDHTKRIPIWGLGCAGGASGLARAFEYCLAFPTESVLVLSIELCSLTFQKGDRSKSNLIGTSLFADGVACTLVVGDSAKTLNRARLSKLPHYIDSQSTTMKNSLDVMGWEVKNEGLYVVFSKDIPTIIEGWLEPNVLTFLNKHHLQMSDIEHFIAHPGGKKVIDAYQKSLGLTKEKTEIPLQVLKEFGNMSSATIFYVLKRFMEQKIDTESYGLAAALGPGFSSELVLLKWG